MDGPPLTYASSTTRELRKRFIQKKEIPVAYICIFMSTSYFIFWIPFYVVSCFGDLRTKSNIKITIYVGMINSIADPVIYIFFHIEVRSSIIKGLTQMFRNS